MTGTRTSAAVVLVVVIVVSRATPAAAGARWSACRGEATASTSGSLPRASAAPAGTALAGRGGSASASARDARGHVHAVVDHRGAWSA